MASWRFVVVFGAVVTVPQRQPGFDTSGQHRQFFIGARHGSSRVKIGIVHALWLKIPFTQLDGIQNVLDLHDGLPPHALEQNTRCLGSPNRRLAGQSSVRCSNHRHRRPPRTSDLAEKPSIAESR